MADGVRQDRLGIAIGQTEALIDGPPYICSPCLLCHWSRKAHPSRIGGPLSWDGLLLTTCGGAIGRRPRLVVPLSPPARTGHWGIRGPSSGPGSRRATAAGRGRDLSA